MRLKIIKKTYHYSVGQIVDVSKNEGFGLLDTGSAIISKDMTPDDYKQAGDKNGNITKLRTDNKG
jgi:hypothetical protein